MWCRVIWAREDSRGTSSLIALGLEAIFNQEVSMESVLAAYGRDFAAGLSALRLDRST